MKLNETLTRVTIWCPRCNSYRVRYGERCQNCRGVSCNHNVRKIVKKEYKKIDEDNF